jgi:hypothetical protein
MKTPDLLTAARAALEKLKYIQAQDEGPYPEMPWRTIDDLELALKAHEDAETIPCRTLYATDADARHEALRPLLGTGTAHPSRPGVSKRRWVNETRKL